MAPESRVSVLLDALSDKRVVGSLPATVHGLTADSRKVEHGDCFVAVPGFKQDARRFIPDAVARGAGLVVTEGEAVPGLALAQVLVPATRPALARLAAAYYGHPSRALTLVGITGTNGKTTTSYLVDALPAPPARPGSSAPSSTSWATRCGRPGRRRRRRSRSRPCWPPCAIAA
jgi:UDP-N-acetylmuramoyl-L-alanyl-D-glutamate--2,6-diaminopimelate ligase